MMDFDWRRAFTERPAEERPAWTTGAVRTLADLKAFLDEVHVRECLLRPYGERVGYPFVAPGDLLPSFECELWEYKDLPGFSMVAFDRPLVSFSEPFQYDVLKVDDAEGTLDDADHSARNAGNLQTVSERLPRGVREGFRDAFSRRDDITALAAYPLMMPFLKDMDRAHVISRNVDGNYALSGVFASFPSDYDGELKRFGLQIGKFRIGDSRLYEENRLFVNQYLMELYGFPISSERRTSSALFARRLFRAGERFIVRVLGQSDRTISTIWADGTDRRAPYVEKWALVQVPDDRRDLWEYLDRERAFVDRDERVVLMHLQYMQHTYHAGNIRQDRALSLERQTVVHPLTGRRLEGLNIVRIRSAMLLTLNDIVRGEFAGRIVYRRSELIERTNTVERKLKALSSWMTKNRRYLISATDEVFADVVMILDEYLAGDEPRSVPMSLDGIRREIVDEYAYIVRARRVQAVFRLMEGGRMGVRGVTNVLQRLIAEIGAIREDIRLYPEDLVRQLDAAIGKVLHNAYIRRMYLTGDEAGLSTYGLRVRRLHAEAMEAYGRMRDEWSHTVG